MTTRLVQRLLRLFGRSPRPAPARYAALLPTPAPEPVPLPAPRPADSEPRELAAYELAGEECPRLDCGLPAASGTHQWRDRGPFQLLSRHTYRCPDGHGWTHETDGG